MHKVGRQIADGRGIGGHKGILLDDRSLGELHILRVERIHLRLQAGGILGHFELGVVGVDDVAIGGLDVCPGLRVALFIAIDQALRLGLHLQLRVRGGENYDVQLGLAQFRRFRI